MLFKFIIILLGVKQFVEANPLSSEVAEDSLTIDQIFKIKNKVTPTMISHGGVLTELDIMTFPDGPATRRKRAFYKPANKWPEGVVPYAFETSFPQTDERFVAAFEKAKKDFEQKTCIRLVPRNEERLYVTNTSQEGCWSEVGQRTRPQLMSLQGPSANSGSCWHASIIIHEFYHALGGRHEHSRPDRDDFVTILYDNIEISYSSQFSKLRDSDWWSGSSPYDYTSVMHYGESAFAKPGTVSMLTKDREFQYIIGRAEYMSEQDMTQLNMFYSCKGTYTMPPSTTPKTPHGIDLGEIEINPTSSAGGGLTTLAILLYLVDVGQS